MILDTNAVSAFGFGERAVAKAAVAHTTLYLPAVVLGEYQYGLLGSVRRIEIESWLNLFLDEVEILDIRRSTALRYAEIQRALKDAGTPIPINDVWVAALASEHGLPVLSRDEHFDRVKGLRRVAW
jgi:predicted nucleic acid-binding protein